MDKGCNGSAFWSIAYGVLFSGVGLLSATMVGGSQGTKQVFVFNKKIEK